MLLANALIAMASLTNPLIVPTADGAVQGIWADEARGVRSFRGLPYAAPPTGERRFAPPAPASAWEGTRDATEFGAACPQPPAPYAFVWSRGPFEQNEDCLYLNVWAPTAPSAAPRAVMVWFHGGSHTTSYAHSAVFDGTELAAKGVVLVTVNYRLGALGFLAHDTLVQDGGSGNWGLMDKVAALQWVQRNIAQFGGDPDKVTIFGQSAGSQSVCALMAASGVPDNLFHRAIGQSAACVLPESAHDADGRLRGHQLAVEALGQVPVSAQALRALPVDALVSAQVSSGWEAQSRITVDGRLLSEHPSQTYREGRQKALPLLAGSLADEGVELLPLKSDLSEAGLRKRVDRLVGDRSEALIRLYSSSGSPGLIWRDILTDRFFALAMRTWAAHQHRVGAPSYLYFMSHVPPAFRIYHPEQPDLELAGGPRSVGAYHSGDLAYVFGTTRRVGAHWRDEDHRLSERMMTLWTNFAKTGDPNGDGLLEWPRYDPDSHATMELAEPPRVLPGARPERLELLSER